MEDAKVAKQIEDLLYQALETELGGVEVYKTALRCAVNEDLKEEWEKYLEQTQNHVQVVSDVLNEMDLDVNQETPGRKVVRHQFINNNSALDSSNSWRMGMKLITVIAFCTWFTCVSVAGSHEARPLPQDVDQAEQEGYTPLMRAADKGQLNVVRALLKKGARVDEKHRAGFTALMLAAEKGHLPVVKVLLVAGANPNVRVPTPHAGEVSPLIWGILSGNPAVVQTLLKAGAEVNPRTWEGGTPLDHAVQQGEVRMINILLAAGADVNAKRSNGYTALMIAAEKFDPEVARALIAAGADVNAINKFGETALSLARKEENDAVIAVLRRAGAKK